MIKIFKTERGFLAFFHKNMDIVNNWYVNDWGHYVIRCKKVVVSR